MGIEKIVEKAENGLDELKNTASKWYNNIKSKTEDNVPYDKSRRNALKTLGVIGGGMVLGPSFAYEAFAGGTKEIEEAKDRCSRETGEDNCMYVDDYYKLAEPVNDPDMPEGLREMPFYAVGSKGNQGQIMRRKDLAVSFDYGEFDDYYFDDKYGSKIKNIFENHGVDTDKLTNLLLTHSNSSVGLYSSGYMLVFDKSEEACYTFPIKQEIPKKIYDL